MNTRFGSFPHSTLIEIPWGSQVRASAVDTGSRGRKGWEGSSKKRKRENGLGPRDKSEEKGEADTKQGPNNIGDIGQKAATEAKSGFVHVLPPTPEMWTLSLPHRTQVVYTPDYSYILHRIRARPGTRLIEAGAGSGSFTHAAARAVFNGYPTDLGDEGVNHSPRSEGQGRVYSFEFHDQRAEKLKQEIWEHGLESVVELTPRDVCTEGFVPMIGPLSALRATAVFLDLPAPWLALKHLTREMPESPLDANAAVHLCTFSPCIEQVQRTIASMRQLGWLEIEMVEIAAKRIEVRRERVGLHEEGLRGVNDSPGTVDEALTRLREVEGRSMSFHEGADRSDEAVVGTSPSKVAYQISKQQRLQNIRDAQEGRKLFKEGRMVTKVEPELKMHTSYLVFAVLPRQWRQADEEKAQAEWPDKVALDHQSMGPMSKRARKKAAMDAAGGNKSTEAQEDITEIAKAAQNFSGDVT